MALRHGRSAGLSGPIPSAGGTIPLSMARSQGCRCRNFPVLLKAATEQVGHTSLSAQTVTETCGATAAGTLGGLTAPRVQASWW